MIHIRALILLSILLPLALLGQGSEVLLPQEFLVQVQKHHPVAKQANLVVLMADANVLKARGAFDPELYYYQAEKKFQNKSYFSIAEGGLQTNTRWGPQFKVNYDVGSGQYLNPADYTPSSGLIEAGVSLPIGQGLFTDESRFALKQAALFREASETQKLILLNQLYIQALGAYYDWLYTGNLLKISEQAYVLAKERFQWVKSSFEGGDRPAIDTVEAYITQQTRYQKYVSAKTEYTNSQILLSNYLWDESEQIVSNINQLKFPDYKSYSRFDELVADSLLRKYSMEYNLQPDLVLYDFKLLTLQAEKRLKTEKLKPKLNLQYQFLAPTMSSYSSNDFMQDNYKWGLQFSMPILLRQGRGDLKLTKLKIKELQWEVKNKQQQIKSKINYFLNQHQNLKIQVQEQRDIVLYTQSLLEAEKQNYLEGEGSLFLINTRENTYLSAQEKWCEWIVKYELNLYGFKAYMALLR